MTTLTIQRHAVPNYRDGLSRLQHELLNHSTPVRIASAPTGAGKSYAFQRAMLQGERVFFMVPTRRLAQNLARGLIDDLIQNRGWEKQAAENKVIIWSSDASRVLREQGVNRIGPYRVRQISELDPTREGGEMIVAIPETLSYLFLQRWMEKGQSDVGIFDLLNGFEHIVFDEFHTIEARGFGLAAAVARVAASGEVRAKVSFLSATPLEIRPVLERLGLPGGQIVELEEEVTRQIDEHSRVIHGDVQLQFDRTETLADLFASEGVAIQSEIAAGRQVVCIYNALVDLQRQLPQLEQLIHPWGLDPRRVLLINSIDDSREGLRTDSPFQTGRQQDPTGFDLLIATASVEMGVTFNADLLLMEPGFSPLNFLQRYGRAARRDRPGRVVVRIDDQLLDKNAWLRDLSRWLKERDGKQATIEELTQRLTASLQRNFSDREAQRPNRFGALPNRAVHSAALYWNVLLQHPSNRGWRGKRLREMAPSQLWLLKRLLKQVLRLAEEPMCADAATAWCKAFERQAFTLRDIDRRVRIREGNGKPVWVTEQWLQRHTDLAGYPVVIADDGEAEIRLMDEDTLGRRILTHSEYIQATRRVLFPITASSAQLPDTPDLPKQWCRELRESPEASVLEDLYPEALKAAEKLTLLTGLVVEDESEMVDTEGSWVV